MAHVEGGREPAMAELERRARAYTPEHPRSPKRRRLFRDGDGFLLVVDGAWQSHATRFSIAELLDDTDRPAPAVGVGDEPTAAEEPPAMTPVGHMSLSLRRRPRRRWSAMRTACR